MAKQTFTTGQVLTAAQMTSLQQTAMLGGAASAKTASYTLVAADAGTAISMSNASATTITVNTALFAAGDTVQITNLGAGVCTITAGTATVNSSASLALAQYESGTLTFTSASAAIFIKGAGPAATSGGMTLLSTTSLTGASTTISGINQTHKHLMIVGKDIYVSSTGQFQLEINGDTGTDYALTNINGNGTSAATSANEDVSGVFVLGYVGTNNTYSKTANFDMTIPRYSETEYHPFNTDFVAYATSLSAWIYYTQRNRYNDTAAITSLKFITANGTFSGGTIYIYGVK